MKLAFLHQTDSTHLAALQTDLALDASPEGVFDDVTHFVAKICGIPIMLVGFIEGDGQSVQKQGGRRRS